MRGGASAGVAIALGMVLTGCATLEAPEPIVGEEFWRSDTWRGAEVIEVSQDADPEAAGSRPSLDEQTDRDVKTSRRPFSIGAAHAKLGNVDISDCWPSATRGYGHIKVTFAPEGDAQLVEVLNPTRGAPVPNKACIAERLRSVAVPAFDGSPVAVKTSFWVL
jgi:hypothetical protein